MSSSDARDTPYTNPHDGASFSAGEPPQMPLETGMSILESGLKQLRAGYQERQDLDLRLAADVECLRAQHPNTGELYKAVCHLLFFKYDQHPTATRLYSLVRRGTNSVPQKALKDFWAEIRKEAKERSAMPSLPAELRESAETFIAGLWVQAQKQAKGAFAKHYEEAEASVARMLQQLQESTATVDQLRGQIDDARRLLESQQALEKTLRDRIDEFTTERASLMEEAVQSQAALNEANKAIADLGEKLRADAAQASRNLEAAESRFRDSEKRLYVEIDRERERIKAADAALQKVREDGAKLEASRRTEISQLYREIGDLKQHAGAVEGKLHASEKRREHLESEVDRLHTQVGSATATAERYREDCDAVNAALVQTRTALSREATSLLEARGQIEVLQSTLDQERRNRPS